MENNKLKISNDVFTITTVGMTVVLKLKGLEKEIFGIINGFSQDNESVFRGSLSYLTYVTGYNKTSVIRALKSLVLKGYVEKDEDFNYGVKYVTYKSNYQKLMKEHKANGGGKMQPVVANYNPEVAECNASGSKMQPSGSKMQPNNIDGNIEIDRSKYILSKSKKMPTESEQQMFDQARKFYLGSKRGLKTEFDNFVKKYPTEWRNILPLLLPAILREKVDKEKKLKNNGFNQQWKNFSTWINGRCWEIEYPNVSEKEVNELGISVTTNESGEQKVEVKQDRSSFPLYSSMQVMPHVYPEGTESRCGYYVIKNKECVRTKKY